MHPQQRRIPLVLLWAALVVSIHLPAAAQDGTRPFRSVVRGAYEPRIMTTPEDGGQQTAGPARIAILGTVAQPGTYLCPPGTDIGRLLSAVGGLTPEASGGITLIRGGRNQGTLAFDLASPEFSRFGALRDGDVAVLNAQRGVRNAHYQWTNVSQQANGPQSSVQHAAREQFAYIACIGLADYPVVLSVPLQQANETSVLLGLLEMNPAAVHRGVRPLHKAAPHEVETLPDGTVLTFDRSALGPNDITAKLQFPAPTPMPAIPEPSMETPAELPSPLEAATSGSNEVTPLPLPVSQRIVTPAGDHQIAPNGHLLTQPLPNLTFAYDRVWNTAVDVSEQAEASPRESANPKVWRPAQVLRGPQSEPGTNASLTDRTIVSASTPAGTLLMDGNVSGSTPLPRTTIRPATAAVIPPADRPEDRMDVVTESSPEEASNRTDIGVIIGIIVASTLCLLAGGLGVREFRKRRGLVLKDLSVRDEIGARPKMVAAPIPVTPLQELLENRLPIIEEPAVPERPIQLHGPVIGQRRLRVDAAHRQVPAPHFARVTTAAETKRQERLQRHLSAATATPRHNPPAREPARSAPPTASGVHPVRYDIVQPEPSDGVVHERGRRPLTPAHQASAQGDLLTRVLSSLREET